MANANAPRGLVPVRYLNGAAWNGAVNTYVILSTDTNAIHVGDLVKSNSTGDAAGTPGITKALAGDMVRGVVVGILVSSPESPSLMGTTLDTSIQYAPAAKARDYYALVVDDPMVLFEAQQGGVGAALTAASAGANIDVIVTDPTAPAQNSATVLDTASVTASAATPLTLISLVKSPDNAFGANAKWLVKINSHEFAAGQAGVIIA